MCLKADMGWGWEEEFRTIVYFFFPHETCFKGLHRFRNCVSILGLSNHHLTLWRIFPRWILLASAGKSILPHPHPPPSTPTNSTKPHAHQALPVFCPEVIRKQEFTMRETRGVNLCLELVPSFPQSTGDKTGTATPQQPKWPNEGHLC